MTFKNTFNHLKAVSNKYDSLSNENKNLLLKQLGTQKLPLTRFTMEYHNLLLFIIAHPSDQNILSLAEAELKRLTQTLKKAPNKTKQVLADSGLPFTTTLSTFSHDLVKWLIQHKEISVKIDSYYKSKIPLSDALQFTLPSLEKEIAAIGYKNKDLLQVLKITKENELSFLVSEFERLNDKPFIKDYLFGGLSLYLKLQPKTELFSKAYNRIRVSAHYFHAENLKQFDQSELLNRKLPKSKTFDKNVLKNTIDVIKNSLTLLQRETDPVTYMDEKSLRLYELERGISIAIYGMTAERQLPLESYVGYTLFKNGFPAAYGGAWVFGKRALFGINIFEPYRGGESGFMMCQLLRVYRQAFGVDYFEVEPYQYGLGNPEGISSGAYWFYYRFGFRSLDKELLQLSEKEFEKIKNQKGYRSSEETLLRFTESNVALQMGKSIPLTVGEVREKVTDWITQNYKGDRTEAEKVVVKNFMSSLGKKVNFTHEQKKVLAETAFLYEVMKLKASPELLQQLVVLKPTDLYSYQQVLLKLLKN